MESVKVDHERENKISEKERWRSIELGTFFLP